MHSKLLDIPLPFSGAHIPIYSYGLMMMLGFLVGLYLARGRATDESVDTSFIADLAAMLLLSGIVGARIAYIIEFREDFSWQLFHISDGGMNIPGALLGGASGAILSYYLPVSRGSGIKPVTIIVPTIVGMLLGARLVHVTFHPADYEGTLDMIKVYRGGLSFYGGLIAATATGILYIRKKGKSVPAIVDIFTPSLAIGLAFGRIGCFLNGCCFGKITDSILGVRFPGNGDSGGSPAWLHHDMMGKFNFAESMSLPVHPTQIYHSLTALGIFFVLIAFYPARRKPGRVFLLFCALYSITRFFVEFLRDDMARPLWGLTAYQLLAIPIFLISAAWFIKGSKWGSHRVPA